MEPYNSNLLGSSAVLTVLGVAAFSAYVSGPLIVDRMSQKMNWVSDCIKIIEREIKLSAPQQPAMPQISCDSMLNMAGRDWGNLARTFGLDQACKAVEFQADLEKQITQEKLSAKISAAPSACECAVSHTIDEKRGSIALHAASARLVTPLAIQNLKTEFMTSLNSPTCASISNLGAKIGG